MKKSTNSKCLGNGNNNDGPAGTDNSKTDGYNDGYLERTAWASSDDGMLVIDLAADGSAGADQTDELQLANWHAEAGHTDLERLADAFDSNTDGVFDAQDSRFGEFRVWQDLDQDGITDDGELRTLSDAGIASINLASDGFGDVALCTL